MNTHNLVAADLAARAQALDPNASFIVQAPAGSGKTEMLIQRLLVLLSHVDCPEEIIAMTFTKKAAFEMRNRLLNALNKARLPEPIAPHAKLTWQLANAVLTRDRDRGWHLTQNPNQLRILTIDALCVFLNKNLPLLSQLGALPPIADEASQLYVEAVQNILSQIDTNQPWSHAIQHLLLQQDNDLNKLQQLFVNMLAKRDQWLAHIQFDFSAEHIRLTLEAHLQRVIEDHLHTLRRELSPSIQTELAAIAVFTGTLSHPTIPDAKAEQLSSWLALSNLLLTQSGTWRKRLDKSIGFPALASLKNPAEKATHLAYRERYNQLIKTLEEQTNLLPLFADLVHLPTPHYTDNQWSVLSDIFIILKALTVELRLIFKKYGEIDYIENTQAALLALGNQMMPTYLMTALDYQIKHILIDEFQDTAYAQFQLLKKLTVSWQKNDGNTLFVVGDPMQSIYRFREAEVGLFISLFSEGLENIDLHALSLSQNFRSATTIVDWNNQHFAGMFPIENDIASGAVRYSHSISPFKNQMPNNSFITMTAFETNDDSHQAHAIVQQINSLQTAAPDDNIAILVRSRSHLSAIIPALKKANIAYDAIDIDPLFTRPAIQDLFALTTALLHPADRIAWLSVLRAPWCGLSLNDLFLISQDPSICILEGIANQLSQTNLSPDGKLRLTRIYPLLLSKYRERAREDLRFWIESTWLAIGGPASIADDNALADAKSFFQLLDNIQKKSALINKEKIRLGLNKLFANSSNQTAKLRIMTIHSSKGLEFDTVILPHLERKNPPDDKAIFSWMEQPFLNGEMGLLLAPLAAVGDDSDALYDYIRRQQKLKLTLETDRLLYVAATRAKKRLCLMFNTKKNSAGEIKSEANSFLDKLWPTIKNDPTLIPQIVTATIDDVAVVSAPAITRLKVSFHSPYSRETTAFVYPRSLNKFTDLKEKPRLIGIVIHTIFDQIAKRGLAWWESRPLTEQCANIMLHLKQIGVAHNDLTSATDLVASGIHKSLNDAVGRWILSPHAEAQSEFAISAVTNRGVEKFVIDRTFVDHNIRWIIDYKTPLVDLSDIAVVTKKYHAQLEKYRRAYQFIDSRPIRLGLYFPAIPQFISLDEPAKMPDSLAV